MDDSARAYIADTYAINNVVCQFLLEIAQEVQQMLR